MQSETLHDAPDTIIDIEKVVAGQSSHVINNMLTIHAMSGCDTVLALAGIGKKRLTKSAVKDFNKDTLSTSVQNILSKLYLSGKNVRTYLIQKVIF